jgi:HlyD family secretion protein
LPQQRFKGRVERIGIESDRVTEERRIWVKCTDCPAAFHLGEQAEVLITVATLPRARLVPETAVQSFDGAKGAVWVVENGRLARRTVAFSYRTEDARFVVAPGAADNLAIVTEAGTGAAEGRPARVIESGKP